jgi:hypothetical protein
LRGIPLWIRGNKTSKMVFQADGGVGPSIATTLQNGHIDANADSTHVIELELPGSRCEVSAVLNALKR